MLDHVTIKNFRCLRDVSVPLKPLTVLIGENDTGKSTFLEAMAYRGGADGAAALGGPRLAEFGKLDHWAGDPKNNVGIEFRSAGVAPFQVEEKTSGSLPRRQVRRAGGELPKTPRPLRMNYLRVDPFNIRFSGTQLTDATELPVIDSRGQQVPGVMDRMLRGHRRQFDRMETRCRELVPGFEGFSIIVPKPGVVALSLWLSGEIELPSERTSAGVRALILYLTLAYRPDAPDVVLVEEPENGLHPKRLGEVMALLRLLTEEKPDGRRTQVILATHSPYLLDHVNVETDQVLVFRREDDGARTAEPIDAAGLKTYLNDFMLGEIWDSVGERGLIDPKRLEDGEDAEPEPARAATPDDPAGAAVVSPMGAAA